MVVGETSKSVRVSVLAQEMSDFFSYARPPPPAHFLRELICEDRKTERKETENEIRKHSI